MHTNKHIVLVVPNFKWADWDENTNWDFIPYNLCLLAAMVEPDFQVTILDANAREMDESQFRQTIHELQPDVVGITVLMDQYGPAGHYGARLVKEVDPAITVVLGGVYATMNSDRLMADSNIDYCCIGEGEYVLPELLGYLAGCNDLPARGVAYRRDGKVVNLGRSPFINDLDALPRPAYHLLDYPSYISKVVKRKAIDLPSAYPYARIQTSRGCPYGCVFCQVESIAGKRFRPRSAEKIVDEIEWLYRQYGVRGIIFEDDNLYTKPARARAIFQMMIDRDLALPWCSISTAIFKCDRELLDLMRTSGCEYINIAVESGNERVLKEVVGKPLELGHAKEMAAYAREIGIYVAANFIIGFPTETWDELLDTIRFAEEINVNYSKIFAAMPLPNTKLWDLCEKTHSFKPGFDPEKLRWSTGQLETEHFSPRDLTILRAYEWDRINFTDPGKRRMTAARMGITEAELLQIRKRTLQKARNFIEE
ncbi:MAG: B12-binding domain-containing radical SAM protein [Proteobacteria bacterium]|nr:B12-binding domain-containing radical SAM protein [Pseudomonadota bacterium]MBU4296680.1 B12-binding domain-containing radical SAM protein [Pseudomonadota bacterium]MCG2748473.1 B12-binding domain-containing radical SAM protein [Desulfobulbaceae bacterium]